MFFSSSWSFHLMNPNFKPGTALKAKLIPLILIFIPGLLAAQGSLYKSGDLIRVDHGDTLTTQLMSAGEWQRTRFEMERVPGPFKMKHLLHRSKVFIIIRMP